MTSWGGCGVPSFGDRWRLSAFHPVNCSHPSMHHMQPPTLITTIQLLKALHQLLDLLILLTHPNHPHSRNTPHAMPKCADAPFTLDKSLPIMALLTGSHPLWISKYPVSTDVPSTLFHDGGWVSVTRTDEELSVLATKEALAAAGMGTPESGDCGGPFTSLRVKGPLEHCELVECLGRGFVLGEVAVGERCCMVDCR